jgi:dTDP-4-dehydrorhamnose 3,5-epimerase
MLLGSTEIEGLWIVEPERVYDARGSFCRTFCRQEFGTLGLSTNFAQHSLSVSLLRHTLRGLHFQTPPHQEVKLVSCVRGAIWDVAVDLRPKSPTYLKWAGVTLSADNGRQFYIPEGFAHGFQSLVDDVAVSYLISTPYVPSSSSGIRYDDPAIAVEWPAKPSVISDRDTDWPALRCPVGVTGSGNPNS